MSERDVGLRLYMRLSAVKSPSLAADVKRVKKMAEAFLSAPVLGGITKAKIDDSKPKNVSAKTRADAATTGEDSMIDYFDNPKPNRGVWVQFNLEDKEIELRCVVETSEIKKHRASALDDLTAAFVRAAEVWNGVAVVREGNIKVEFDGESPPYARLRKPRDNMRFPQRSLVTFLDRAFAQRADEFKALTEPKPAHATVTTHGDLVAIRWAKGLSDREIEQASTWHDCWIRRIATTPDDTFNEQGDEKVDAGDAEPAKPLTLYNSWLKTGFKAVLVTPKGGLEKTAWNDACSVLKKKALPNGDEVEKLWIVAPLREHAVAVHDRVVEAGFEGSLYPGEGTEFWDPVPKGPWLSASTDNGTQVD